LLAKDQERYLCTVTASVADLTVWF